MRNIKHNTAITLLTGLSHSLVFHACNLFIYAIFLIYNPKDSLTGAL